MYPYGARAVVFIFFLFFWTSWIEDRVEGGTKVEILSLMFFLLRSLVVTFDQRGWERGWRKSCPLSLGTFLI